MFLLNTNSDNSDILRTSKSIPIYDALVETLHQNLISCNNFIFLAIDAQN
jgi:hypothetical protein